MPRVVCQPFHIRPVRVHDVDFPVAIPVRSEDKPFFVGARSLEIVRKKPLTRRLVGVVFPSEHSGPLPEECHLIISNGEIVGRITSIAEQSTLGYPIAMAFVRPDMAEPGTKIQIRVDDRSMVRAEVSNLPFYDPENRRQR